MFSRCVASVAAMWLAFVGATEAASITSSLSKEGKTIISLDGEIVHGDAEKLKSVIKLANDSGRLVSGIRFNSPGGNLLEGVELAEAIKFARVATVVANGATCASACFLAFAAGYEKYASYGSHVGVHGASDKSGNETLQSNAATVSMARIAKELGVPPGVIGKLVVTPPDKMVWLSPDDLRSMGTTLTGRPVQTRSTEEPPMQVAPPSSSVSAVAKPSAASQWSELVRRGTELSTRQNGKPQYSRNCQPEIKLCSTALFYENNKGVKTMLRVAEDMKGKIIERAVCEFNEFSDVRVCYDWETGETSREMKDRHGKWSKVADQ